MKRDIRFWLIQGPGWLLLVYLIYAQAIPAFDYDLGVAMGTQESAEQISDVGAAFWYGFAFGDLVTYIPLLTMGLIVNSGEFREFGNSGIRNSANSANSNFGDSLLKAMSALSVGRHPQHLTEK